MFSVQDRTYIRHFLGFAAIFKQADPRLENAITAIQSTADGGSQPDSTEENYVKGLLYGTVAQTGSPVTPGPAPQNVAFAMVATTGLLTIEQQLSQTATLNFVVSVDGGEQRVSPARGMAILRSEGRRLVNHLARKLSTAPRADIFSSIEPNPRGDAFYDLPDGTGNYRDW